MKVTIQIVIESDAAALKVVEDIACLTRGTLSPETLGLSLAEAKRLLRQVQSTMANEQVADYLTQQRHCPDCGAQHAHKGHHTIVYRTLYGKLTLPSPRYYACGCHNATKQHSFSPLATLLPERSAPELLYLEGKWASLMSYGLTVDLLKDVLPLDGV